MKKGFTLIELLAVIVILAIIALIAFPTISGLVEKARIGSIEQSANGYVDAVDKQIALNLMDNDDNNDLNEGVYDAPLDSYNVKVKGQKPTSGWVEVTKSGVGKYSLVIGDYVVSYDGENKTVVKGNTANKKPAVDTIIYRFSNDMLHNGDKIDLENRKYSPFEQKYQCLVNGVMTDADKINIEDYTNEELEEIAKTCEYREAEYDMTGIYSTNLNDVLTIATNIDGTPIESRSNPAYLKHTVNSEGVITKSEACLKTSWGTLCQTGGEGIYDEANDKWNDPNYDLKYVNLDNFFHNSSKSDNISCYGRGNYLECNDYLLNFRAFVASSGSVSSSDTSVNVRCYVDDDRSSACISF